MLIQNVGRTPLVLIALHSLDDELLARVNVKAYLKTIGLKEEALEQIVTRLSLEAGVTAISWEVVAAVDAEDASLLFGLDYLLSNPLFTPLPPLRKLFGAGAPLACSALKTAV